MRSGPKGGPTTVSTGRGDHGSISYGTYQLSSKMGTAATFVKRMGYSSYFGHTTPGSPAFSALWKKAPDYYPNFGKDQHEFIRLTHYQSQIDFLKKNGIDLSKRGPAVHDAIWSTSVQFGGKTTLIINALSERPVNKMSDKEIVSVIQDYKINKNDSLFRSSSSAVRKSTLNRAKSEKAKLISLAESNQEIPKAIVNLFDGLSELRI